jgi:hypothetical protein
MYTLLRKKYVLCGFVCTLFLVAACGGNEHTTQVGKSTPTQTAHTTKTVVPTATVQASPTVQGATPTATEGSKPMPSPSANDAIIVATDKAGYAKSNSITVTVTNNSSATIYASAYYTNCTPVQMQLKSGAGWTIQGRCPEATQAALVIQPGSSRVFVLRPSASPMTSRVSSATAWTAGTYRASFNYTLQADPDSAQGGINIVSEEFTIN